MSTTCFLATHNSARFICRHPSLNIRFRVAICWRRLMIVLGASLVVSLLMFAVFSIYPVVWPYHTKSNACIRIKGHEHAIISHNMTTNHRLIIIIIITHRQQLCVEGAGEQTSLSTKLCCGIWERDVKLLPLQVSINQTYYIWFLVFVQMGIEMRE